MVIEHTFVTTRDAADIMQAAMHFLAARGFAQPAGPAAFPMGGEWKDLELRRGRKNAARAKSVVELPQIARVHFDRGRVTVLLTIEASHAWGGSGGGFQLTHGSIQGNPKKMQLHTQLLMAIATGLEDVLLHNTAPEVAIQSWDRAEQAAHAAAKKRRRRNAIIAVVVIGIGLFAALFGSIAFVATYAD